MNKILKQKIYEAWIPKIKKHLEEQGMKKERITEQKLKDLAVMSHVRNIYESYASGATTPGRGGFNFGDANTKGSGETFQSLFGLFLESAAANVGMEFLPNIPMTKSNAIVYVAEPIYANSKLDNKDTLVEVFKVKPIITGTVPLAIGTTYTVKTAAAAGEDLIDLIYVGKHRLKNFLLFRPKNKRAGQASKTIGEVLDSTVTNAGIYVDADNHIKFDGDSVDYVEGFTNFVGGYTGAGENDTASWKQGRNDGTYLTQPMSRGVGETTYYRSMGMRLWHDTFKAGTFHVDIEYTNEQLQDMKMDLETDGVELGNKIISNELDQGLNDYILSHIFAAGWENHADMHEYNGFNLNTYINAANQTAGAKTYVDLSNTQRTIAGASGILPNTGAIAENLSTLQRRIISRMFYGSAIINNRARLGKGNQSILNTTMAAAVMDIRGFEANPFDNEFDDSGLFVTGKIGGMKVAEDPLMNVTDNRISISRHGNDDDPGLKFMPFIIAEKFETVAEGTMARKTALKSRAVIAKTGSNPQLNYMTFVVENGSGYAII